ncbi:hypothetical protein TNCV_9131 [Trichonephila clavipes]|nr:hypothetical protein TNCV_9131 [Trichonephila clavipes]
MVSSRRHYRPSSAEYASPIVMVKKNDESSRKCIDYRKLNQKLVKDKFPLPIIEDVLDTLPEASGTIKPSPTKTLAVRKFPEPTTIKQLQSFLGLTGYFRKYIKDYSKIAKPLSDLTKVRRNFVTRSRRWKVTSRLLHVEKTNTAEEKYDSYELEPDRRFQLEEFDYEIEHRAGSRMKHVDALSRYPVMMVNSPSFISDEGQDNTNQSPPLKKRKIWDYKKHPFILMDDVDEIWPKMKEFYKLSDFPTSQFLSRCEDRKKRNIYFTSKIVKNIIQENLGNIKVMNAGVHIFCRSENKDTTCIYRLTQEGVSTISPFMSDRKMDIKLEDLIVLLTNECPAHTLFNEETQQKLNEVGSGCLILCYTGNKGADDEFDIELCGWKGNLTLRCYIPEVGSAHYLRICGVDVPPYERREKKKFKISSIQVTEICYNNYLGNLQSSTPVPKGSWTFLPETVVSEVVISPQDKFLVFGNSLFSKTIPAYEVCCHVPTTTSPVAAGKVPSEMYSALINGKRECIAVIMF